MLSLYFQLRWQMNQCLSIIFAKACLVSVFVCAWSCHIIVRLRWQWEHHDFIVRLCKLFICKIKSHGEFLNSNIYQLRKQISWNYKKAGFSELLWGTEKIRDSTKKQTKNRVSQAKSLLKIIFTVNECWFYCPDLLSNCIWQ